ncbi:RNA polymerase sigma factor [Flavivirga spongiicola]|uniref:RNA polymerase sigma factor n=1 Tax=Flavivirga spongiicola TaxID=421621 RepID=A0ABU7XXF6_9FLAO|nr:RNA polymerase sigma-70 factor [Flavivirga sp. MEBiC05379]MDO5980218.1 RNA polymerase sigma-70 factor [Flavivirga sp. MEBiC05379]
MSILKSYDESTLLSLKNGEISAFEIIFNIYKKKLNVFIFSITKSKYSTDEILQNVFIIVWNTKSNINVSKSFDSFIYTIARNLAYSHIRAIATKDSLKQELWKHMSHPTCSIEDEIIYEEYRDVLDDILAGLPKQKRAIFILSREEGKSNQEIADLLGISNKTVKNHLWKTLQLIREQLEPHIKNL